VLNVLVLTNCDHVLTLPNCRTFRCTFGIVEKPSTRWNACLSFGIFRLMKKNKYFEKSSPMQQFFIRNLKLNPF
jgi:hypothetical protein